VRIIAFTGPEILRGTQESYVRGVVRNLEDIDHFVSGCARGTDSAAGWEALMFFPDAQHTFVVPHGFRHNTEMVKDLVKRKITDKVRVEYMKDGGPLERNRRMNEISNELMAFPKTLEEILRSGTWSTIRHARKIGNVVRAYPLDMSGPFLWEKGTWVQA
jgi:predicted Rossmann fold nucleotide-binding protein DprA/Smf involved in DNA uptake